MTELMCRYSGDRDQAIVSYLYDDVDPAERAAFDAHLSTCERCRAELSALHGVRASLGRWTPPESARPFAFEAGSRRGGAWKALASIPRWVQVAAALVVLGVAAGIANLDVRYDAGGLRVRTGWSAAAAAPVAESGRPADAPWRAELTALEQRLRSDWHQPDRPATKAANPGELANAGNRANSVNNETLRRVRALIEESERRQQRELALHLAEAMRDVNAQRQADLVKIDHSIGAMQNNTGFEILRQRETINNINNYLVRTSSQQRPQ